MFTQDNSSLTAPAAKRQNPYYQAQDILSRRDHSEAEVRRKLLRKGFTPEVIDQVVSRLYQQNLLNDVAFAQRYVEGTLTHKPVGPRWFTLHLQQRGVESSISKQVIDQAFADSDREKDLIVQAASNWQRQHAKTQNDRQRLWRFLVARGFTLDQISRYLEALA